MAEINDKTEMYRLLSSGKLGNTLLSWPVEDYLKTNYTGNVGLRYNGEAGKNYPEYARPKTRSEVIELIQIWKNLGADVSRISVNEVTYDKDFAYNAELTRDESYLYLHVHYDKTISCREAMRRPIEPGEGEIKKGLVAKEFLCYTLGTDGYSSLQDIFETYPNAVIEFSAFNEYVGIEKKKFCIWEVRTGY